MTLDILELPLPTGEKIAYRHARGKSGRPGVLFCGGFHSDMEGTKASFLHRKLSGCGRAFVRFDYRGHGRSSGRFEDGTIGDWYADALAVLDRVCEGPQTVVGSSMGAWMAMLLSRDRPGRIASLVLIAPAPDFPRKLLWPSLPAEGRRAIKRDGAWPRPSEFEDDPYPITRKLIEESAAHELLDGPPIPFTGPVRILHGLRDEVVPLAHAERCLEAFGSDDVQLTVTKAGDHRLSKDADLERLFQAVSEPA